MPKKRRHRISLEELLNSITHGIGLALSIAGFVVLLILAATRGTAWQIVSCAVYGTTLVALYAASTLYHGIPDPKRKTHFQNPRSLRNLSTDRRHLHAIPTSKSTRPLGLDAPRNSLDASRSRNRSSNSAS